MSLPELRWEWIAGGAAAVLLLYWILRRRRDPAPATEPDVPEAAAARADAWRALEQQKAQAAQIQALSRRVAAVEEKLAGMPGTEAHPDEAAPPPRDDGEGPDGFLEAIDSRLSGSAGPGGGAVGSWQPGPGDQPVEVRDGVLVTSRSLPPAAYVAPLGGGHGRVFLNADVPMTEYSLPKWSTFFDLQGARPYAAYRTTRPAEVRWDEGQGRGELVSRGLAEAI